MASVFRQPFRLRLAVALIAALSLLAAMAVIGPPEASAQESEPQICLYDSQGNGRSGAVVKYWTSGSWGGTIGTTGDDGCIAVDTSKNTNTRLRITYLRGEVTTDVVDFSNGYTFHMSKVTLANADLIRYQGYYIGWGTFTNGMDLLPGTYTFSRYNTNNSANHVQITVGDEDLSATVVRLVDHQGNGLAGGTASYYTTGWHSAPGETDSNGYLVIPAMHPNLHVQMYYKNTTRSKNPGQLAASNFTFQTTLVTVKLQDSAGNPLDTGKADYHAYYNVGGGDGLTQNGEVSQEMLAGTIPFGMSFNGKRVQANHVISGTTTDVVFQTGRLTLHYSGSVNHGSWIATQKSGMEFLPGNWKFHLNSTSSPCTVDIAIESGQQYVKRLIATRLTNSNNQGIAGGSASAYVGGSWKTVGETNSQGWACGAFDGGPLGNTSVKMTHTGTSQQLTQHHATNSIYLFKTIDVVVELRNSNGNLMDTGNASYYAGSWRTLDPTSSGITTVQMLPGKYSFAMVYNGTREQMNNVVVQAGTTVTFQTSEVTVSLLDSNSNPLANGSATYYAGSWRTIGTTDGNGEVTVEMLPGNYSFAMVYNGTREQKNSQTVNDNGVASAVGFQTIGVTVELVDTDGAALSGGASSYYAGSWKNIDSSGAVEMLTGKYSFAMTYLGTREQKNSVDIGANATVTFQTGQVFSSTSTGYYAGAWRPFTDGMELLKGKYTFRFSDGPNQAITLLGDGDATVIN